ncbi:MAG: glycosyltransferase family 2 protein [Verrucomicrobiales bacterium]|nr:glycosyltransferase family 2 protein [Verrucomicrobiales bacterium]
MEIEIPEVSVIVPCYNAEGFLAETLDCVLAQSFQKWECIVVDDASSDGSREVILAYSARDPRFHAVLLNENQGAAGARNEALAKVRGKFIAFLDADDYWKPEKLTLQVACAAEQGAAIVHSSYRFIDENGAFLRGGVEASERVDLRSYMKNTEIGMSTSLIDRDQVGSFAFKDIRLCQDTHLWLELLGRGFDSHGLKETLVYYRVREGQISGSKVAMAKQVFALWMDRKEVSPFFRLWSFACYALNGFRKRLGVMS